MLIPTFNSAPRRSLVDYVENELKTALIEGRLLPDTRLVTKDLAASLGISITPAREALVRFAAMGVLRAEPAQSYRVPRLTIEEYQELVAIRKAVEGLAAEHAAQHISEEEIDELETGINKYLEAKNSGDTPKALALNRDFRFTLYRAARMPTLVNVIENLWLRVGPVFNFLYPEENVVLASHHNYQELLTALRKRDPAAARLAIEHAIDDGTDRVVLALKRNKIPGSE